MPMSYDIDITNITQIIRKARGYLENITPVKGDCGILCGSLCCKNLYPNNNQNCDNGDNCGNNGNDGERGMWLFPGEDALYKNNENFKVIHAGINGGNNGYPFLLCRYSGENGEKSEKSKKGENGGFCKRSERPLFCRLFPYFPLVSETKRRGETNYNSNYNYRIKLIIHPAAVRMCPAVNAYYKLKITSDFSRAVKNAVYVMINQKGEAGGELKNYIVETGEYLNHMTEFANRVYGK